MDKKWYQKDWGIILLCVLFFPVGLYLVWKKSEWSKRNKIIATVCVILLIGFSQTQTSPSSTSYSGNISLSQATRIAKEKCQGAGQCQFCDVYRNVENQDGNYGILLGCGGGPRDYLLYEISKNGQVMSAEYTD